MKNFLFITNGHGEDIVASRIISDLLVRGARASALPLVGEGKLFESLGIDIFGDRKPLPSGGFSFRNLASLPRDIAAGLFGKILSDLKILKKLKNKFDAVIAVGDSITLLAAARVKTPFIFIGINKSHYYRTYGADYTGPELWLMKKWARIVFARDEVTARNLKARGINSVFVGNPMMDCIELSGSAMDKDKDTLIIGLLPGTRALASLNAQDLLECALEIERQAPSGKKTVFLMAFSDIRNFSAEEFPGWMTEIGSNGNISLLKKGRTAITIKGFGDVISSADLTIGLSGTGNEQAAGLGKPVISFPGRGTQYTKGFARAQKQLLGEALRVVKRDPKAVAEAAWEILGDGSVYRKMSAEGRQRMGAPGGSRKIAEMIA